MNTSTYPYRSVRPRITNWLVAGLTLVVLAVVIGVGVHFTKSEPEPMLVDAELCATITSTYQQEVECWLGG